MSRILDELLPNAVSFSFRGLPVATSLELSTLMSPSEATTARRLAHDAGLSPTVTESTNAW